MPPAPARADAVPTGIRPVNLAALTPRGSVDCSSTLIARREFRLIKDLDAADLDAADLDAWMPQTVANALPASVVTG
jgi:hypothetical protein